MVNSEVLQTGDYEFLSNNFYEKIQWEEKKISDTPWMFGLNLLLPNETSQERFKGFALDTKKRFRLNFTGRLQMF